MRKILQMVKAGAVELVLQTMGTVLKLGREVTVVELIVQPVGTALEEIMTWTWTETATAKILTSNIGSIWQQQKNIQRYDNI